MPRGLSGALPVRRGAGLKQHLFKQKPNRTSSLTQLANGILFPHSNLLLMLPSPGLPVSLPWEDCTASPGGAATRPSLSRPEPLRSLQREGSWRCRLGQPGLRKSRLQTVAYVIFRSNPLCGGGRSPFPSPHSCLSRKANCSCLAWVLPLGGEMTC